MMKNTADVEFQPLGKNIFSKIPVAKKTNFVKKTNLVPNASLSKFKYSNSKGSESMACSFLEGRMGEEGVEVKFPLGRV